MQPKDLQTDHDLARALVVSLRKEPKDLFLLAPNQAKHAGLTLSLLRLRINFALKLVQINQHCLAVGRVSLILADCIEKFEREVLFLYALEECLARRQLL